MPNLQGLVHGLTHGRFILDQYLLDELESRCLESFHLYILSFSMIYIYKRINEMAPMRHIVWSLAQKHISVNK